MRLAVLIQPGYPPARLRRWVSTLKPDTTLVMFDGIAKGSEYLTVELAARSRRLPVEVTKQPGHGHLDAVVVMRDRDAVVPAEKKARAAGVPVVVIEARIWG